MHIQQLQLDRIGHTRDVSVDQLEAGFNLVLGPPGSGKSSLVELVRSLIFGYQQGAIENSVTTGAAIVAGPDGRYRVTRRWTGGGPGELSSQTVDSHLPLRSAESLLPAVSDRLFDKVLHASFRRGYDINGAVAEAEASLSRRHVASFEISDLERRLAAEESRRAEWLRSDQGGSPIDEAARRRESLLAEIADLESRWSRQSESRQRRVSELEQLIIQIVSIGNNNNRWIFHARMTDHFPGIEYHGQALTASLCVPYHTDALSSEMFGARPPFWSILLYNRRFFFLKTRISANEH